MYKHNKDKNKCKKIKSFTEYGGLNEMSPICLRHLNTWSPVVGGCLGKFRRCGLFGRNVSLGTGLESPKLPVFLIFCFEM